MAGKHRPAPYGWHNVNAEVFELPHEQAVIKEVVNMAVLGNKYEHIADHLNNKGVPTPGKVSKWSRQSIAWLLNGNNKVVQEGIRKQFH